MERTDCVKPLGSYHVNRKIDFMLNLSLLQNIKILIQRIGMHKMHGFPLNSNYKLKRFLRINQTEI